ncbi:MAG TPA: EthD domain-containing protein [Steroidobacteraceae bacterium]|nr:EthD domain-containing protein [Steroidobacteraceae bacterium]
MIKRVSLVWKRAHLSDADFRRLWLGEHVEVARRIPGVLEYTIDFSSQAPDGAPSGIATLRFESPEALDAAFSDPQLNEKLRRTREVFAERVQVMLVDECIVSPRTLQERIR